MLYASYLFALLGLIAYIISVFHIGGSVGETYSDVGNALLLFTAVLLLFRQAWREPNQKRSANAETS